MVTSATVTGKTAHTNNMLHGFESFRFPNLNYPAPPLPPAHPAFSPQTAGGVPVDLPLSTPPPPATAYPILPKTLPTYDNAVNGHVNSDGLNEADEMNLYQPNPQLDTPFTASDLEWLYRQQDVDGKSLVSRLASLAPISFSNTVPGDAQRRRRMFAIDTWETNNFVWANDNPGGAFSTNFRFAQNADASFKNLNVVTPSLAHRDKKINLNYPLPVSNDPYEPVRQKWISETYQLLKWILPPKAIDTPEELAQLSQFVINIIDYRDPDCTMTHWVNPDVLYVPSTVPTSYPTLVAKSATPPANSIALEQYGMEYNPIAINEVLAYSYRRKNGTFPAAYDTPRFYLELVNTLTAPETAGATTNASMIDLSGFLPASATPGMPWARGCWDVIFTDDAANSRPDPFLGQLQPGATLYGLIPLVPDSFTTPPGDVQSNPLPQTPGTTGGTYFGTGTGITSYFLTIGNPVPDPTAETPAPASVFTLTGANDPVDFRTAAPTGTGTTPPATGSIYLPPGVLPLPVGSTVPVTIYPGKIAGGGTAAAPAALALGTGNYYWICLRRPANPFAPVSATNPMVVVDSMRFPYIESGGTGTTDTTLGARQDTVTPGANSLFSYQRLQPYRGGHAVPAPLGLGAGIDTRYGYTEQVAAPVTASGDYVLYGTDASNVSTTAGASHLTPASIYHTLGFPNDGAYSTPTTAPGIQEYWDLFPFHDRDFTSAFELTLVPGCPPGLFTKQFAEFAPSSTNAASFVAAAGATLTSPLVAPIALPALPAPLRPTQLRPPALMRRTIFCAAALRAPARLTRSPTWSTSFFTRGTGARTRQTRRIPRSAAAQPTAGSRCSTSSRYPAR